MASITHSKLVLHEATEWQHVWLCPLCNYADPHSPSDPDYPRPRYCMGGGDAMLHERVPMFSAVAVHRSTYYRP